VLACCQLQPSQACLFSSVAVLLPAALLADAAAAAAMTQQQQLRLPPPHLQQPLRHARRPQLLQLALRQQQLLLPAQLLLPLLAHAPDW
jgi:hypothetical protein